MSYSVPHVISGLRAPPGPWFGGPYYIGGNWYVVGVDSADNKKTKLMKGVENGGVITWTAQTGGAAGPHTHTQPITTLWTHLWAGTSKIRIVTLASPLANTTDTIWVQTFDASIDQFVNNFGEDQSIITSFSGRADLKSNDRMSCILSRQNFAGVDRDVIIYNGNPVKIVQTWYDRVYYAFDLDPVITPGNWIIDQALSPGGSLDWYAGSALGVGQRVHFTFGDFTSGLVYQRTIYGGTPPSFPTLESMPASSDTVEVASGPYIKFNRGIIFGASNLVRFPYRNSTGKVSWAEFTSSDTPGTFTPNTPQSEKIVKASGQFPQVQMDAVQLDGDPGILERQAYQESVAGDMLFHQEDWEADEALPATSGGTNLSAQIATVSGGRVVMMIMNDYGSVEYTETDMVFGNGGSGLLGVTSCVGRLTRCRA